MGDVPQNMRLFTAYVDPQTFGQLAVLKDRSFNQADNIGEAAHWIRANLEKRRPQMTQENYHALEALVLAQFDLAASLVASRDELLKTAEKITREIHGILERTLTLSQNTTE